MTGGLATEYYGLEVHQDLDNHVVSLSCAKYLQKTMQKLGLAPKKWVTPMDQTLDLPVRTADVPPDPKVQKRYRQLVGTAMHPSVTCRSDVSAAVRALSVHLQNPGKEHVKAAERVMQYSHCTRHLKLLLMLSEVYYTYLLLYNTLLHALNAPNAHKCETLFGNQSPIGNGAHLATVAPPVVRPGSLCTLRRESQTVPCDGR